jgi:hypothetical protein
MQPNEIHALLIAEGARTNLPECYKRDLEVHDLAQLTERESQNFIWVLRTCGTHIFELDNFKNAPGNRPTDLVKCVGRFGDSAIQYYHFSNGVLTAVTYDKAFAIAESAVREKSAARGN